jgi:sulfite exporter TauE/SafE
MMGPDAGTLTLGAAFVAGIAGSGHCLGMCGGVAGALAMRARTTADPAAGGVSRVAVALAYNLSRITSYAIAGALAGLLGRTLVRAVDVAPLSIALRVAAGLIMFAAAGRLLFNWRLLDPIEAAGAALWRRVVPRSRPDEQRGGLAGAVSLGLAWGWLPCGLTYSMLLLAASTASVTTGALAMAAFGLGTLPSMLTATIAFERAARALTSRSSLRTVAGTLLLACGAWTAGNALYHGLAHTQHSVRAPAESATDTQAPAAADSPAAGHQHH